MQSLGCVLYALCFFRSPFDIVHVRGDSVALAIAGASRATIAVDAAAPYSEQVIDLIFDMLNVDAAHRPTVDMVIERVNELIERDSRADKAGNNAAAAV